MPRQASKHAGSRADAIFFKKIVAKLRAFDTFHVPPRKATVSLVETQSGERKINHKIR
jgi:hypothetical protein